MVGLAPSLVVLQRVSEQLSKYTNLILLPTLHELSGSCQLMTGKDDTLIQPT